jgi:hypothetical protein
MQARSRGRVLCNRQNHQRQRSWLRGFTAESWIDRRVVVKRFWNKVAKSDGCWLWTSVTSRDGYGLFHLDGKHQSAHRVAFVLTNGDIPEGMELHHKCENPVCVRPDHLEVVTHKENMLKSATTKPLEYCRKDLHKMEGHNIMLNAGVRCCRACRYEYNRRRRSALS